MQVYSVLIASLVVLGISWVAVRLSRRPSWEQGDPRRSGRVAAVVAILVVGFLAPFSWAQADLGYVRYALQWVGAAQAVVLTTGFVARTWPRPSGSRRQASLEPRAGVTSLPGRVRLLVLSAGVLVVAVLVCGLAADGSQTAITRTWNGQSGSGQPFPGWFGGLPIAVGVAVLLLETWWAVQAVGAIPRGPGHALDDATRLRLLDRILRGALFGTAAGGACVLIPAWMGTNLATQRMRVGAGVAGHEDFPRAPWDWVQDLGLLGCVIGVGLIAIALSAFVRAPEPTPADSGSAAATTANAGTGA